jgi:hypothetical protein
MQFYICPFTGTGTITNPFRPAGVDGLWWRMIDLRHEGINRCFVVLRDGSPNPSGSFNMGTTAQLDSVLTTQQRNTIQPQTGKLPPAGTTRRQLFRYLFNRAGRLHLGEDGAEPVDG